MSTSEQQLLDLWVNQRDAEAFKAIANRYAGLVYATCRRILGDPTEAQDVAQECFEALAGSDRRPGGYLAPWLHRVATTKSLQRIRSDGNRRRREKAFVPVHADPVADVVQREMYSAVDAAIAALPEELRVPIVVHFLENKTQESIAADLGVSRQTVTYRIGKGIDLVRKRLPVNAAFSVATLADLVKPAAQTPPALVAAIGKLALAGQGVPVAGLATFASAKVIVAVMALVCAGGFALLHMPRSAPNVGMAVPVPPTTLASNQTKTVEPQAVATVVANPVSTATPSPVPVGPDPSIAPSSSESVNSAVPAADPRFPPLPKTFLPHAFLEEGLENGKVVFSCRQFVLSQEIRRGEFPDGRVIIFDLSNRSEFWIDDEEKRATKRIYADYPPARHYHPFEMMTMTAGPQGPKYVGTKTVDGSECNGFRADNQGFDATLWIDKQTSLPVRMEGLQKATGRTIIESEYDFNMNTDPKRFDMTPPDGYAYSEEIVHDTWWSRLTQGVRSWWSWSLSWF